MPHPIETEKNFKLFLNWFREIIRLGQGAEGVVFAVEDQEDKDEIKEMYEILTLLRKFVSFLLLNYLNLNL